MAKNVPLSLLRVGMTLSSQLCDRDGRLLLGTGVEITLELLEKLQRRGIQQVLIELDDWKRAVAFQSHGRLRDPAPGLRNLSCQETCRGTESMDRVISGSLETDLLPSEDPFNNLVRKHGASPYESAQLNRVFAQHQRTVADAANAIDRLQEGQSVGQQSLERIVQDSLVEAARDMDVFVSMGINPALVDSIAEHTTRVANLAVAIGATLGLDAEALRELGAGCLLHDVGMLLIDQEIPAARRRLESYELAEIARHPVLASDLLDRNMPDAPIGVRMIVYQMHERCNGTGYPRGWTGEKIHRLAKIASAADAYIAMVSPRPYRHALMPYYAMKKMLEDVAEGAFDPSVVRALLYTTSLFPLGSYCELTDGRLGKVVRSNGKDYDKPIVEAAPSNQPHIEPELVNLVESNVRIAKTLSEFR
ncbi:MAG: HD domain-containing protein [Planctomycetales bacterium]|nr:HD domain-containing protein [Planctomycetales bacterium]